MNNVINMATHAARANTTAETTVTSPDQLAMTIAVEALLEERRERYGWMEGAESVPKRLTTGSPVTDAMGLALALSEAGRECSESTEVFKLTMEFFNKLLVPLDEGERAGVLETLDASAARALLMLDYSEKLKAAELGPLVDAALRARA